MKELYEKYLSEGLYKKGKMDIEGLWKAAKGFIETAETQYNNDFYSGALQTLNNLQKNVLKDLITGLKSK